MSSKGSSLLKFNTYGVALILIFSLSLLAYSNSFHASFHFDDFHQLVKNTRLHSLDNITRTFTDPGMASYNPELAGYRPLTFSGFALSWTLFGGNVFGHHLINFAMHIICAFLLYLVVRAVLVKSGTDGPNGPALLIAVLFAVHPVQTSAVTYISGRAAIQAAMFYLLSFLAFLKYREARVPGTSRTLWMLAAPILYLAALLSKEMAVSLVGVMAAYDLIFTGTTPSGAGWRRWPYYAPFLGVTAVFLVVKKSLQGYFAAPGTAHTVGEYLMSEAHALLIYLRLLVFPANQNADYDLPATASVDVRVVAAALIVGAALFLLYRMRKTDPVLAFFGFWFFIALAPESTLVPIEDIAVEYRLYLPSAGFIAALVLLAWRSAKARAPARAAAVSVVLLFVALSFSRNSAWATEYTLWSDTVRKSPHSARAYTNLGQALLEEKRYPEASAALKRALEINPYFSQVGRAYNELGRYLYDTGRYEESVRQFEDAIRLEPSLIEAYENLGAAYYRMGRFGEAAGVLERAVARSPLYPYTRKNLALCYMELGRSEDALVQMREAARLVPTDFGVIYSLALLYDARGMKVQALSEARSALSLASDVEQKKEAGSLVARLSGEAG